MAYIGATELSGLLPNAVPTLTGSSRPLSMGDVATICERVSVELDTAAAIAGYFVPISTTATQAYGQMALYNSWGAACRTLQIVFPGGGVAAEMPLAQDYCNDFKAVLDRLRDSEEVLIGAPTDPTESTRTLPRSLSTSDPTATSGVQAQAQVGMKF
jgi:hypothetical protein